MYNRLCVSVLIMKNIYIVILLIYSMLPLYAQQIGVVEEVGKLGLPVMLVNTNEGELPTGTLVESPEGSLGTSLADKTVVPSRVVIVDNGNTIYDSGDFVEDESGCTLSLSGNTSNLGTYRPYKIKLQQKADLLFRGSSQYADKEWRLLSGEKALLLTTGYMVSDIIGMPWTPQFRFCNLIINDKYIGCYILIESVKRNATCRISVDKNTGYIVERDPYWWNEDKYFGTGFYETDKYYRWTYNYPSGKYITNNQIDYIRDFINKAEKEILDPDGNFEEFLDVESAAKWILCHDILGTYDSGGSNLYIAKYNNKPGSKLTVPVLWDFDSSFDERRQSAFSRMHSSSHGYFKHLFASNNHVFVATYKKLWQKYREKVTEAFDAFPQEVISSTQFGRVQASLDYAAKVNKRKSLKLTTEYSTYYLWIDKHLEWLDNEIGRLDAGEEKTVLPIIEITADNLSVNYSKAQISIDNGYSHPIEIKYRGASSLSKTKKSFALKFVDEIGNKVDISLLGMRSDNSWILDAMAIDVARMRNRVSMDLWNDFSSEPYIKSNNKDAVNGTNGRFVEVYLNGEYWGIYCLTEKIDRKQLKLKKCDDDTQKGVLYKSISWTTMYSRNGSYYKYDNASTQWNGWEIEYPDKNDGEPTNWEPLASTIHWLSYAGMTTIADSLAFKIDVPVWQDYYLLMDFICAEDNICKNQRVYFQDASNDNCMIGIAPWDMDHSWGRDYKGDITDKTNREFPLVTTYNRVCDILMNKYSNIGKSFEERYAEIRANHFSPDSLKERFNRYFALFRETGAGQREEERWSGTDGIALDFESEQAYIEQWIDGRVAYMDKKYNYDESSAIVQPSKDDMRMGIYNIHGQVISSPNINTLPKGIYIVNGRKIII